MQPMPVMKTRSRTGPATVALGSNDGQFTTAIPPAPRAHAWAACAGDRSGCERRLRFAGVSCFTTCSNQRPARGSLLGNLSPLDREEEDDDFDSSVVHRDDRVEPADQTARRAR